ARVRSEEDLGTMGIDASGALAVAFGVGRAGGLANHKFRMNRNKVRKSSLAADALQQDAGSGGAHLSERLANRGEAGIVECGALDVVKSYDGDVRGDLQTAVHEGANGADGGNVVVAEQCGKVCAALQQFVGGLEPKFRRGDAEFEADNKFGRYG